MNRNDTAHVCQPPLANTHSLKMTIGTDTQINVPEIVRLLFCNIRMTTLWDIKIAQFRNSARHHRRNQPWRTKECKWRWNTVPKPIPAWVCCASMLSCEYSTVSVYEYMMLMGEAMTIRDTHGKAQRLWITSKFGLIGGNAHRRPESYNDKWVHPPCAIGSRTRPMNWFNCMVSPVASWIIHGWHRLGKTGEEWPWLTWWWSICSFQVCHKLIMKYEIVIYIHRYTINHEVIEAIQNNYTLKNCVSNAFSEGKFSPLFSNTTWATTIQWPIFRGQNML